MFSSNRFQFFPEYLHIAGRTMVALLIYLTMPLTIYAQEYDGNYYSEPNNDAAQSSALMQHDLSVLGSLGAAANLAAAGGLAWGPTTSKVPVCNPSDVAQLWLLQGKKGLKTSGTKYNHVAQWHSVTRKRASDGAFQINLDQGYVELECVWRIPLLARAGWDIVFKRLANGTTRVYKTHITDSTQYRFWDESSLRVTFEIQDKIENDVNPAANSYTEKRYSYTKKERTEVGFSLWLFRGLREPYSSTEKSEIATQVWREGTSLGSANTIVRDCKQGYSEFLTNNQSTHGPAAGIDGSYQWWNKTKVYGDRGGTVSWSHPNPRPRTPPIDERCDVESIVADALAELKAYEESEVIPPENRNWPYE